MTKHDAPSAKNPAASPGPTGLRLLGRAPAVLMLLLFAVIGVLGVASRDFGYHWDEASIVRVVQRSLESGVLLPRWYAYPSVPYDITLLTALSRLPRPAVGDTALASGEAVSHLGDTDFKLELRAIFFVLSLLSAWPVYLLARRLTGSGWSGLFAGAVLVTSWEFVYHARWIAPDSLVLLFASLTLWAQHRLMDPREADRRRVWIAASSCFAGLCIGSKYPGGILLVPQLLAVAFAPRTGSDRFSVARQAGLSLLIAAFTFVLVTPGCVLEPMRFISDVQGEMDHYAYGHGGYTVGAGWDHFSKLMTYLGVVQFSSNVWAAGGVAGMALVGAVFQFKTQWRKATWLLSMPILFVVYMSMQRVMIVRNYLILMPCLAVVAGIGLQVIVRAAASRRVPRYLVIGVALAIVGFNIVYATSSSLSIVFPNTTPRVVALEKRLTSAPGTKFCLSPACLALLEENGAARPANVVGSMASADRFIFSSDEVRDWREFAANKLGRYRTIWSRMQEVNWDYYPSWAGYPRILEVSAHDLRVEGT